MEKAQKISMIVAANYFRYSSISFERQWSRLATRIKHYALIKILTNHNLVNEESDLRAGKQRLQKRRICSLVILNQN